MVVLGATDDWKKFLNPRDEQELAELLQNVTKYRGAYFNAKEVRIAQLWCAILEVKKQNEFLNQRLSRIEFLLEGMLLRARMSKHSQEELIETLGKF